jgi:hypothetical protein
MLDEVTVCALASELPGVTDEAWADFVRGMATRGATDISEGNALGMFELTPRRLADLGYVEGLQRTCVRGRTMWVAKFKGKMTSAKFLRNPRAQYAAFVKSMKDYADKISAGVIRKPEGMTLAGALAILHRGGPNGLQNWERGERFATTEMLYNRVAEAF